MSDSSIVPERQLVFSPGLAATIGLEEAIFLQHLQELLQHRSPQLRDGYAWLSVPREYLLTSLPFWEPAELHRVCRSLVDKGVLLIESPPLHSADRLVFAINEPAMAKAPVAQPAPEPAPQKRSAAHMSMRWSPSEDLLQLLTLNHNIPRPFALDQLEDFVFYWRERGEPSHAWENKFRQHVISHWRREQQDKAEAFREQDATKLDASWRPSADAMEIFERGGIDREFIDQAVPEFVLYWRERTATKGSPPPRELNSKFIQHIRIQWAKFTSAMEHSTEPKRISEQWYPAGDVFDILVMSHIDAEFARTLIPEFIMYWRDSNQAHTSWNTKFIQHVKYNWAKRHQMEQAGQSNAGQAGSSQTSRTRDRSLEQDLNDTSWAD
ncbi:MAG: DnaT-like ssDNA-binding domain-containing protein [Halioglobus sp.]